MSCIGVPTNINETFVIEPIFVSGTTPTYTACTALYTNTIISCSGDTEINMGTGVISFNGSIYTNYNLSGSTINASNYFSGGTNLLDIFSQGNPSITGGTFNPLTKDLTYIKSDNTEIMVELPVRVLLNTTALTTTNSYTIIDTITGITNNSNSFVISYLNAFNDATDYGFWKRTLAINKFGGSVSIIGENVDFDREATGFTPTSIVYVSNTGNIDIMISGQTGKNYNWNSNWELI